MTPVVIVAMNPAVDVYYPVRQMLTGRKLRCRSLHRQVGGGGVNVARALRSLGGEGLLIHLNGGAAGEAILESLQREEVPNRAIPISGEIRENVVIQEEVSGEQLRIVLPGPDVAEEEWLQVVTAAEESLIPGGYLVASGSLPPGVPNDFYARLARLAHDRGARFVLDAPGEPLRRGAREGVFLLKPNLRELGRLAGREVRGREDQEEVALRLLADGACELLVLSLGGAGVLVASGGKTERFRAPQVPMRSKIGAGDSMVAGIVYALSAGRPVREAILFGIAAGTSAVTAPGTGLCDRAEVFSLYEHLREEFPG